MITTIHFLLIALTSIMVTAIALIFLIGADMVYYEYTQYRASVRAQQSKARHSVDENRRKERLRKEKEMAAHEGFFEESYVPRFLPNGATMYNLVIIPTPRALEHYKTMDRLADEQIFENTKEL